jgi:hypothetical protein
VVLGICWRSACESPFGLCPVVCKYGHMLNKTKQSNDEQRDTSHGWSYHKYDAYSVKIIVVHYTARQRGQHNMQACKAWNSYTLEIYKSVSNATMGQTVKEGGMQGWESTFSVSFADSPGCVWQSIAKSTHAGIRAIAASVASATAAFTSLTAHTWQVVNNS